MINFGPIPGRPTIFFQARGKTARRKIKYKRKKYAVYETFITQLFWHDTKNNSFFYFEKIIVKNATHNAFWSNVLDVYQWLAHTV